MIRSEREPGRQPPEAYAAFLRRAAGSNPFGGANVILAWGENGACYGSGGFVPAQNGLPCWNLCVWHPPEDAGPPERWREDISGPYPQFGFYEIVQPMYHAKNGKLDDIEPMPLNFKALEVLVWGLKKHQHDSHEERQKAFKERAERKDREVRERIADVLQDAWPAFNGAESFSGVQNSVVRKRMEVIERNLGTIPMHGRGIKKAF